MGIPKYFSASVSDQTSRDNKTNRNNYKFHEKRKRIFQYDTVWYSYWNMFFHIDFMHHIFHTHDVKGYILLVEAYVISKTKYMTLGPNFYIFSVLSPLICFCFVNPLFFCGMCRIFRDLAFGNIKTRFKGLWDIFSKICMRPWIRRHRFYWIFAPRGRLNYEAYNADTKS